MFNKKKKYIFKLECENRSLRSDIELFKDRINELKTELEGGRTQGLHCVSCKYSYNQSPYSLFPTHSCLLNIKCKDYKNKSEG